MRVATQDKPFFPEEWDQKLAAVKELGFDGFEIEGKSLLNQFSKVQKAIERTRLPIIGICGGYRGWIGDFDRKQRIQALDDIKQMLQAAKELGIAGIVAPAAWGMFSLRLPPTVPPRTREEDRAVLLESLAILNHAAQETQTWIFLEPLNRYEDHMINTLSDAHSLIQEGGWDRVLITADFYHMNIEENQIPDTIRAYGPKIGHVHLADNHRYEPGTGHTNFLSGIQALHENGYAGVLTFECRVIGYPPLDAYRKSLDYIRTLIFNTESRWGSDPG